MKNGTKVKTGNTAGNRQIASDWISASQTTWFTEASSLISENLDLDTV